MKQKNKKYRVIRKAVYAVSSILAWGVTCFWYINYCNSEYIIADESLLFITSVSDIEVAGTGEEKVGGILETDYEDDLGQIGVDGEDTKIEDTEIEDTEIEDTEIEDTAMITPTTPAGLDLTGLDEATAISLCSQNGYTYTIEYYLGGNGTVISQSPAFSEYIEAGSNITINIGISHSDFSNKLLGLINEKRRAAGLGELSFSEQLNEVCGILAQENVNSVDCVRPDGSHWSTALFENGVSLYDGTFTTRNNITSLSSTDKRIKYAGNQYGQGNLLTESYTVIGMAYSSDNMLVIIVGH